MLGEAWSPVKWRVVAISARNGEGIPHLLSVMDEMLDLDPVTRAMLEIPAKEGALLHDLHEHARVISSKLSGTIYRIEADLPASVRKRLEPFVL